MARSDAMERSIVSAAFFAIHDGWSTERVVVDPEMNLKFIDECRRGGLQAEAARCNRILWNLRKTGRLRSPKLKRIRIADHDQYAFAAEISIRMLEHRDAVTLDDVLCDPIRVAEFDRLCEQLAPGFAPLLYRTAALSLRKRSRLKPELLSRIVAPEIAVRAPTKGLVVNDLPDRAAIYQFMCEDGLLYVGETEHLRSRIRQHLNHSDNRDLARWLWDNTDRAMFIEYHVLPEGTASRTRKAIELELIRSRNPRFNVRR